MDPMTCVLRLLLILAMTFGALTAPDVSSAKASDMAMAQMNTAEIADQSCGGCDLNGFAGDVLCQGGCPVPCSFGGTIGIVGLTPSVRFAMPLGVVVPVAEPLIPLGANPSLDPFPPKLPV